MRILVYDVAADSGGAVTVLKSFYEEFCRDTENEYVFVLSVFELPDTEHIRVLNYPWVKKVHSTGCISIMYGRIVW